MPEFDSKAFLATLDDSPGVYQMMSAAGEPIYVGKARSLKKRVASYFRSSGLPPKTQAMMRHVANIEVIRTHTESEALLLENNLIKKHRPRYNVVLRDDKSYPYIHLDDSTEFPRLGFYRGNRSQPGRYFGPYANAGAVREILAQLQKIFPVRQCEDTFYRTRSRPCLQYQIERCTAPCVGYVDAERYRRDVEQAVLFLEGRNDRLHHYLSDTMEKASSEMDFETAAMYRDRIRSLARIQETQSISSGDGDWDVVALAMEAGAACIDVTFVRSGRHSGSKAFFPRINLETRAEEVMSAFLGQFYLDKPVPPQILVHPAPRGAALIEGMLSEREGRKVRLQARPRGRRARLLDSATENARHHLAGHLCEQAGQVEKRESLQRILGLEAVPQRMECVDVSHTQGEAAVVSCVVFDEGGPETADYRRYNVKPGAPGDDYAALREALSRRYKKLKDGEGRVPDLLIIDGGKGQLAVAEEVLEELQIDGVSIMAVAKGPTRKPGFEKLYVSGTRHAIRPRAHSTGLHLIQQIRDEAHRFAITGHRRRRARARVTSSLQEIPGVGQKRRQSLLRHLGGLQEIQRAGIDDLSKVPGISSDLARRIYKHFHQ
ncbi:MAG: excinuclease ABC subunit UvrC [Arenicellales bacterium]